MANQSMHMGQFVQDGKNGRLMSFFLSDPSPIIGNACHSLTHSLTDSLLFSKLD